MIRPDLPQHHGDGLRVFVLEAVGESLFLHVVEFFPHVAAGGAADFFHDIAHPFGGQILVQQALGRLVIAHYRAGGRHARHEFEQQVLHQRRFDRADGRHHHGNLPQFVVVEHGPHPRLMPFAEREHQDRGALGSAQLPLLRPFRQVTGELRQYAADLVCGARVVGFIARCVGHGLDQAAGISWSQWRIIETVSSGFLSASSPTFWTDWAWTWPWIWAMSIILAATLGSPALDGSTSEAAMASIVPGANSPAAPPCAVKAFGSSGVTMRRTKGRTTSSSTTRPSTPITTISMARMMSSLVNFIASNQPVGSRIVSAGVSAKRRLTTSTSSPRF